MKQRLNLIEWGKVGLSLGVFAAILMLVAGGLVAGLGGDIFTGVSVGLGGGMAVFFAVSISGAVFYGAGAFITQYIGFWNQGRFWKIFQVGLTWNVILNLLRVMIVPSTALIETGVMLIVMNLVFAAVADFASQRIYRANI